MTCSNLFISYIRLYIEKKFLNEQTKDTIKPTDINKNGSEMTFFYKERKKENFSSKNYWKCEIVYMKWGREYEIRVRDYARI